MGSMEYYYEMAKAGVVGALVPTLAVAAIFFVLGSVGAVPLALWGTALSSSLSAWTIHGFVPYMTLGAQIVGLASIPRMLSLAVPAMEELKATEALDEEESNLHLRKMFSALGGLAMGGLGIMLGGGVGPQVLSHTLSL